MTNGRRSNPPAIAPTINKNGIIKVVGNSIRPVPKKVTPNAPKYNWPSAPIFQNLALPIYRPLKGKL